VRIGGDHPVAEVSATSATTVSVSAATIIRADARTLGHGGRVVVWSDHDTTFDGSVSARGGAAGGDGGFVEISGAGSLNYGGTADTSAPAGKPGALLLDPKNLVIDEVTGLLPQISFVDPHPTPAGHFGQSVTVLSNGNVVVPIPSDNFGGISAGAVYLYDGMTGALLSSLVGSSANDFVGVFGVVALTNGNYVVPSSRWNGNRGAATWGSGTAGVSGVVSAANSLVGSSANDFVGVFGVVALTNGNYVVPSSRWNGNRGAATWGSGTAGVSGAVSVANSLVGSSAFDSVGRFFTALSNGNYVVVSELWNGNRGAATWGSGTAGVSGAVSAANSLVGSLANDFVGSSGVTALTNGNYVVLSPSWNGNRGAATWVSGTSGQTLDGSGSVSPQNSLVGLTASSGLGTVVDDPSHQAFITTFPSEASGRVSSGFADANQLTFARGQAQTLTITPALLTRTLNSGGAVILQASNDITINSAITVSAGGSGGALTLQAGRSILLNASITTDNGALTLIANDTLDSGVVDAQRDPGIAVITMASGATLNTGTGALTIELRDGAGKTNSDSGAVTLQTLSAGTLSVTNNGPTTGSDVILGMVTTGGAQTYASPNGTTVATDNLATTDSPVTFTSSVLLNAGLTLSVGAGTVTFAGGTLTPNPGVFSIAGGLALASSTTFSALLNGTDPASYSQVTASGSIDLGSSTLTLTLGFTPEMGDSFTLLTAGDGSSIAGTFAGLDEGATFSQGGFTFQITYQGGPNGNSVVLTRVS
jgi:Repeat of unknown function (DUF5650)